MSGLGIASGSGAPFGYDISKWDPPPGCKPFETPEWASRKDEGRAKIMRRAALVDPAHAAVDRALASKLEPDSDYPPPASMASARWMMSRRVWVTGQLWRLYDERPGTVTVITVTPDSWRIPADELLHVDPRRLRSRLRKALYDCGAATATGFLAGFLHGEFDPRTAVYPLHMHIMAADGMIDVVDQLRELPTYKAVRTGSGDGKHGYRPVMIEREPLTNIPYPLSYLLKSEWRSHPSLPSTDGIIRRAKFSSSLPAPRQVEVLRWMDLWSLPDITLLMKLRVTRECLVWRP